MNMNLLLSTLLQLKDNEYKQYMFMHLNPVFYELERQLTNLTIADKIKTTPTEE